jgi:SAM-dependent methyltransferase
MHDTAMEHGKLFFDTYLTRSNGLTIVDVGAQDIVGSLRTVAPPNCKYVGLDFAEGKGVDMVMTDPYKLPLEDNSVDVVVSSSCFEHAEFFWLSFNEVMRILKPQGLFYLNVPSNGAFHRYPVDCWRFYPDAGKALQNWGRRSGYPVVLLESFIGIQKRDIWNDFVAVFLKDEQHLDQHPNRILNNFREILNGIRHGDEQFINQLQPSQDQNAHTKLKQILQSVATIMKT